LEFKKKHAFLYLVGRGDEEKDAQADDTRRIYNDVAYVLFARFPDSSSSIKALPMVGILSSVANSVLTLHSIV
jgi:hypothetical protein